MYKIIGGDEREYGPVTPEQLRLWISEGRVNARTKARMLEKIEAAAGPIAGKTAAVLGLSFKENVNDIRNSKVIDLSRTAHYSWDEFWEPISPAGDRKVILEPEEFYILASKERIRVPAGYAAEMVAYEAACGELRTHYAGFFDPGFGYGRGEIRGTQVVLEVRPHDVPFLIHDGQTFFKVVYDRMLEIPTHVYGAALGSSYQRQGLTLSKQFKA